MLEEDDEEDCCEGQEGPYISHHARPVGLGNNDASPLGSFGASMNSRLRSGRSPTEAEDRTDNRKLELLVAIFEPSLLIKEVSLPPAARDRWLRIATTPSVEGNASPVDGFLAEYFEPSSTAEQGNAY